MSIKHILCARQVLRAKHLVVNDSDTDALDALMESAVLNFILFSIFCFGGSCCGHSIK